MPARIIDGKHLAEQAQDDIARRVGVLRARGVSVRLDAVLVESGDNSAVVYAENQARTCERLGISYRLHRLPPDTDLAELAAHLGRLGDDPACHAIMVHLPVPAGIDPYEVQRRIPPEKDVEGVNPANIGNVVYGRSLWAPCTALAALRLIESTGVKLRGARAVVVGASNHVGKPIAVLLMRNETTVISCNKFTADLAELARSAGVLVSAAGVPGLITPEMVKPGAIVVDVGVNRITDAEGKRRTVGDVDFEGVRGVAGYLSPVPGGVGPMTVTVLLTNVVEAAERSG
jgi:methylenetetrahydrofolate dehydrogenase (NADP+)/methenyltetrahydrofolate cyclohydrolase